MQHILANAEFGVERNGGAIAKIGLHKYDFRAARGCDWLQRLNERVASVTARS
jgi:hypothetical protein